MGRAAKRAPSPRTSTPMEVRMPQADDSSRSLVPFQQDATLVAVIEMSQSSWLVAATVPGVDRQPRKKIVPDETALLRLLLRWRDEAIQSGRRVRGRPRRVLAGAMVDRTRHRGPRHSSDQRRGVARAQAGQDGQARHGDADTRVHRMAARRTRALWHGRRPDDRGRGCQTPEPGAREPGRGAHAHRQSAEGGPGAARHSRVQTGATPGCAASGNAANSRGPADSFEHARRDAARSRPARGNPRADRSDRTGALGTAEADAERSAARNVATVGEDRRRRHRNRGHAGAGSALTQSA